VALLGANATLAHGPAQASVSDPTTTNDPQYLQLNASGQVDYEIAPDGGTSTTARDQHGWVTSVTDALSRTTQYALDAQGYTTLETLPDGHTIQSAYQPAFHALTLLTDENGHSTSYSYDSQGHLIQVKDAANDVTSYGYNSNTGLLTTVTDPLNHTTPFA
jgi:YD repeat-containing protein